MSPTDLRMPSLGYGAANLGNLFRALSDDDATAVLEAAWDSGIRHYDTAPHYGLGLSERRLGAFLRTKPRDSRATQVRQNAELMAVRIPEDFWVELAAEELTPS